MMDSQENTQEKGKMEEVVKPESVSPVEKEPVETKSEQVQVQDVQPEESVPAEETEPQKIEGDVSSVSTTETISTAERQEKPVSDEPKTTEVSSVEENNVQGVAPETGMEKEDLTKKEYKTKDEILKRVTEIARSKENPNKEEIDHLKTAFYKLHTAEREAKMKAYIDGGGVPDQYSVLPDDTEEAFKAEMQVIKEKRARLFQQQEEEKQENLQKKLAIIDKIKAMATSPEAANRSYQDFKALQQEWREIKAVPAEKANELWRNYQLYVEQFYDLLNLNREAREYDFKKNLEMKTKLCEAAEHLAEEKDVISAFHQLQELHQEYREIGPVAKDLRETIWARFKAASTVINKRHQQHFEEIRAQEEENLTKKTALCEQVEAIGKEENRGAGDWERHTKAIIALQTEWKKIGFAPQKMNVKIFERFRAACDDFFGRKAAFFKELKKQFAENAEKKKALVEKAQALADSTEWKSTSDKLIALQKEWKTIGMVPKKQGDKLWQDFLTACNHFFDARNAANAGAHKEEHENLDKKREIISQLKALLQTPGEQVEEEVQKLVDAYNEVGHVPYKDKDKIYKEYHDVLDQIYQDLHISTVRHRLDSFRNNLKNVAERGVDALDNERSRLMHRYETLKQEINTYENNLGFLNASSKKGNSLIDEMNRKVQRQKDELELVKQKIKAIDEKNKEE